MTAVLARARGGFAFVRRVMARANADDVPLVAGYFAFTAMLSAFPFMIFATALTGALIGQEQAQSLVASLFDVMPDHVAETLEPVVLEVIGRQRGGLLTVAALGTIWGASGAIEALRRGLDKAYGGEPRQHRIMGRLVSVLMVIAGFFTFVILGVLVILAPLAERLFEAVTGQSIPTALSLLRYVVSVGILAGYLWLLHRLLPVRRMGGMRLWPGIVTTVVLWAVVAVLMSVFFSYAPDYAITYGALAGVVVTLLFFQITGFVIMLGAEINAILNPRTRCGNPTG